jgi:hypothetical protein
VEVAFKRPILLPGEVEFYETVDADGRIQFGVRDTRKGRSHLDGVTFSD